MKAPPGPVTLYGQKRRRRRGKRAGIRIKTRQREHPSKAIETIVSARTPNYRQQKDWFYIEVKILNQKPLPSLSRYEGDPCPESSRLPLSTLSPVAYNAKKRFPTFLLCNARSLCNKIDEIDVVLRQNNVSVAAITETWNLTEVTGRLTGYALYLRTRQALGDQRLGGRVALYVREDILMKELRELESTEHEAVSVWCKPSAMPRAYSCIIFASIYYPESAKNRRDLVTYLQKTVEHLRAFIGNPAIVLAGDFNQTKKSWLASCLSLKQVVNFPTHESGSILDLILTNCETYYQTPESLGPLACSDHNVVLWSAASSIPKLKIKRVKYLPLTDSAICTYGRWLATYSFPEVYGDKSFEKRMPTVQRSSPCQIPRVFSWKDFH